MFYLLWHKPGSAGAKHIADMLSAKGSLTSISLLGNNFDDETAAMFGSAAAFAFGAGRPCSRPSTEPFLAHLQ